jgi:hypothetical protein
LVSDAVVEAEAHPHALTSAEISSVVNEWVSLEVLGQAEIPKEGNLPLLPPQFVRWTEPTNGFGCWCSEFWGSEEDMRRAQMTLEDTRAQEILGEKCDETLEVISP